jgi:hypothetical protein
MPAGLTRPETCRPVRGRDVGDTAVGLAGHSGARRKPDDRSIGQRLEVLAPADVDIMRAAIHAVDDQIMTVA